MYEGILGIKKPIFGLDIGHNTLKLIQAKGTGKHARIISINEVEIPVNSITKEGVKDKKKLSEAIKQAAYDSKPHPVSARIVSTALPESLVFTKSVDIPKMSEKEINKTIPYQASEFFPIPSDETYMDWQIVGQIPANNMYEVLVVAAPKIIVDTLIETIKMAGFEPMGLETKPVAITRALIEPQDTSTYLILDIGAKTTSLICFDQSTIKLTSTISRGGDDLKENFAASIKSLSSEIVHIIKYYQNRIGQAQLFKKIILAGGGANVDKVRETIEQLTKIRTEVGQSLAKMENYDPKFAVALGLALKTI